tara:strand:+ start:79 stop:1698 length:1620 start_codon:yes stop_codon:yes gene_type:complete
MKFTPFPTFGGKQGITGIQPIQIAQARPQFPTARPPTRRAPEPTMREKLGGIAPLFLRGAAELFRPKSSEPLMTAEKFYESIGEDPKKPSRSGEAQLAAYTAFGPQRDVGGFRGMDLVDLVAASQMGRGAPAYVRSALSLRGAEDARDTAVNKSRGQLIKEYLKPDTYNFVNAVDKNAAALGMYATVSARENSRTGALEILLPDGSYRAAGPNYLKQTGTQNIDPPEDLNAKALKDIIEPFDEKERALIGFNNVVQSTIETLDSIGEGDLTPNTLTTAMVGIGDRARIEFNNVSQLLGREGRLFGNVDDFGAGQSGGVGREGTGLIAEELYSATQAVIKDPTNKEAIARQEKALAAFDKISEESYGYTLRNKMDKTVYNDVRLRSQFLQLGYTAAAINGQTGRTLSDKDLAYHLEIVGLGQTTNPRVLKKNLMAFMKQSMDGVDDELNIALQQAYPRFAGDIRTNPVIQSYYNPYYVIPIDTNNVYLYPDNIGTYQFKSFSKRRPGFGLERYDSMGVVQPTDVSTINDYDSIFDEEFGT